MKENYVSEIFETTGESISNYFLSLQENPFKLISVILDIAIVIYVIVKIIKFAKDSRGMQLIKGILFFIIITWLSGILNLRIVHSVLTSILPSGVVALIVIFQPEIRRALEQLGTNKLTNFLGMEKSIETKTREDIYKIVSNEYEEIPQVGVEIIGKLNNYSNLEIISMAIESLKSINKNYILEISNIDFISAIFDEINLEENLKIAGAIEKIAKDNDINLNQSDEDELEKEKQEFISKFIDTIEIKKDNKGNLILEKINFRRGFINELLKFYNAGIFDVAVPVMINNNEEIIKGSRMSKDELNKYLNKMNEYFETSFYEMYEKIDDETNEIILEYQPKIDEKIIRFVALTNSNNFPILAEDIKDKYGIVSYKTNKLLEN